VTEEIHTAHPEPGGAVESWLDEFFDGLAGSGAGGRRALAEIEDHLTAAVDEARSNGLTPVEAERQAVSRFGSPAMVARGIRSAHRDRVRPALTGGWVLASAAALALGLSTGLAALLSGVFGGRVVGVDCTAVVVDRYRRSAWPPIPPPASIRGPGATWSSCGAAHEARALGTAGLVLLALGVLLAVALGVARRRSPMRNTAWLPRRPVLAAGAILFLLAGLVVLANPFNTFGVPQFSLYGWPAAASCGLVATLAAMAATMWLGRLRQRPRGVTVAS
jgi:hypothetical protein